MRHCSVALQDRKAQFALFRCEGEVLDEVVVTLFAQGHSYTGEETVELSCHGSLYVQQTVLRALIESGARMAEPGEFTQRAFLNGRLDLSQAEAVADLIDATSQSAHALAISQLRGSYAERLRQLRQRFIDLTALLELELDFSDEDVEFADRGQLLSIVDELQHECRTMADSFRQGNAIRRGVPVAILGSPNVGKSTLLNALVGDERAIVSDIAGTTRDTIEDTLVIDGILFRFIDTAGLRQSHDQIESVGIERSYAAATRAHTLLYLVDSATQQLQVDAQLVDLARHVDLAGRRLIVIQTKCDLAQPVSLNMGEDIAVVPIAARTGQGIEAVKQQLVGDMPSFDNATPVVANQRHFEALQHIVDILPGIASGLQHGTPADLLVIDIRDALYHLGTITGQIAPAEVLHSIFSRFCVGK